MKRAILALLLLGMAGPLAANEREQVPMIGLDGPDLDACGGIGALTHFEAELSVRERPDDYAREKDRLPTKTLVWLCEGDEEWQGIVYPTGEFQELEDCKVSVPIAAPEPYAGPCAFGWVAARNVQMVSG
jgi:hypothetical protein